MKTIRLHCQILSPIHIGTNLEIDPLQYVVQDGKFYRFSLDRFVSSLGDQEREQFESLIEKSDLVLLRNYMADRINIERDTIYSVDVSPEVAHQYKGKFNDIRNRLLIQQFIRTQNQKTPFFPGSSIKGAIRTAVVNQLAQGTNLSQPRNFKEELQFESSVMRYKDPKSDPFRGIKIRDAQFSNDDMQIAFIKNMAKNDYGHIRPTGVSMVCETTNSGLSKPNISFTTNLIYDEQLFASGTINKTVNTELIVESCQNFYLQKLEMEHANFYKGNEVESASNQLLSETFDSDSFPLRVGRFSGVESVTLDGYRNPRPPGRNKGWGKTRNLAHGNLPMGWIKVTMIKDAD